MTTCKIILLGESGVGKTCIITRFINNDFIKETRSTISVNFISQPIKFEEYDKTVCFDIWDTAGQEHYRSITKIFYKNAKIIIFVYDITRKKTFEEIKNYWYNEVKQNGPKDASKINIFNLYL